MNESVEIFRPVEGFPGYRISNFGRLQGCRHGRSKADVPWKDRCSFRHVNGYSVVTLAAGGRKKKYFIHRLVLEAFVGPCPAGMQARHLNGNSADNHLSNLAWGTPRENSDDCRRHGTRRHGSKCHQAKLTESQVEKIRLAFSRGVSRAQLAATYGISVTSISRLCHGSHWSHAPGPLVVGYEKVRRGQQVNTCKLSEQSVAVLRRLRRRGMPLRTLAARFGISDSQTLRICNYESWRHVG